jgi:hypothetical protein
MQKTIEELSIEVLAALAELSALVGGSVGSTIGGWTAADIQTGAQVAARITYIYANCMPSPQRAAALAKLGELLSRLENTN